MGARDRSVPWAEEGTGKPRLARDWAAAVAPYATAGRAAVELTLAGGYARALAADARLTDPG